MDAPSDPPALYEQIARKLGKLIREGSMQPGDRLPSVRRACEQHGVSLTTAMQAYRSLEDQGLIEARPKSGFFVRSQWLGGAMMPSKSKGGLSPTRVGVESLQSRIFDAARMPDVVPLGAAYPGADLLPVKKLGLIMASVARKAGPRGVIYEMPPGSEHLRREIAKRSLDWGTHLPPEELIITCGGTEALAICLRAVVRAGDVVAVESPTYFGVLQQMEALGLKALEIPMDPRTGMDLDALERAVRNRRIAACLAVPNFSNPLGSLMPDENKRRLLEILAKRDVPLIEDDINGALHHEGSRPRVVQSFDREGRVLLCGSFSKTLAPGYRVGWVAPGRFFERVKALKLTGTLATASLPQFSIAELIANGGYDHHLRSLRKNLAGQIARMSAAIVDSFPAGTRLTRPAGGFVLWVELPGNVPALRLHERALAQRISIAPGPMFSASHGFQNFIRINCGHSWSSRTEQAVVSLGRLVEKMM